MGEGKNNKGKIMGLVLIKRRLSKIILTAVLSLIAMNTLIAKEVSWAGDKEQDQILANIKKSDVLSEQKKLGKEVLEKANQESKQYEVLGQLEKFDKSDTLEHEKLADQIFKKVKKDKPKYEKVVRNIDTKKEENWAKGFAKEAEAKIYKYSQTQLENKESTAVSQINDTDKYLSYFNKILQDSKKGTKIRDGLYIAVSLSMPKETLVDLYKLAEKYDSG